MASVIRGDDRHRQRFLEYSRLKYGGVMDGWLQEIHLEIVRCETCQHHWYAEQPEPAQLGSMYESARSFFGDIEITREATPAMHEQMQALRALIGGKSRPSMLDYGSGYGRWARAACAAGFNVVAFEPSRARGHEAESGFTIVHQIDDLQQMRFAAVNLEQVLEHVPAPLDVLREVGGLCQPGGIVRITVPNILRTHERAQIWNDWPFNGKCVHTMAPFEHLHGFTPRSLIAVVRRAGLQVLPILNVVRSHPALAVRRIGGALRDRWGRTMVLATAES